MAVFNVVQKRRRAAIAERKRKVHGDAYTGKVKHKVQNTTISGKRKRKILKKWRRDQKEAVEKGLITMEDIEMAIADGSGTSSQEASKSPMRFNMKKSPKIKSKKAIKKDRKGKNKRPNQGSSDPNQGSSDPNQGSSDPNLGSSDPNQGSSDPNQGSSDVMMVE